MEHVDRGERGARASGELGELGALGELGELGALGALGALGELGEQRAEQRALRAAILDRSLSRAEAGHEASGAARAARDALASGSWALMDVFEAGGRRFVVAREKPVGAACALSRREREVAALLGAGRSQKEISFALGVSPSAVSRATARLRGSLGVTSTTELARALSVVSAA